MADPAKRSVRCFRRAAASLADSGKSLLLGIDAASMTAELDPP